MLSFNNIYRWDYDDAGNYSSNYGQSRAYLKHDITSLLNGNIYYALRDIPANTAFSLTNWGGMANYNGIQKPHFLWIPSYNATIDHIPKVKKIQFGDGYTQRSQDGINNQLITAELIFDLRTTQEACAILHFLKARRGVESFLFSLPAPYTRGLFVCSQWQHSVPFKNNHAIRGKFDEVII